METMPGMISLELIRQVYKCKADDGWKPTATTTLSMPTIKRIAVQDMMTPMSPGMI